MNIVIKFFYGACLFISIGQPSYAYDNDAKDISHIVSKQEFIRYKDVADFIEHSPKVTIAVTPSEVDIEQYGPELIKSLTGFDCDRDGKMDDNPTCNAVYVKLWLKYSR